MKGARRFPLNPQLPVRKRHACIVGDRTCDDPVDELRSRRRTGSTRRPPYRFTPLLDCETFYEILLPHTMNIEHLKLYHYPATRSARVKWMLHEVVGDDFEVEKVALYEGVQYSAEFLHLNPNHGVPVLQITWDTGEIQRMIESAAMVTFLADSYPDKGLAPPPGKSRERADYLQMLHFGSTWMDMMLWQVRIHEHVLPASERDPRTVARYRKKFAEEVEPQVARRLQEAPYICGDGFTAADCVVGHSVFWARGYGLCRDEPFRRYLSTLSKRSAFASAFADVREFTPAVPQDYALVKLFTG
jgi:glutathione S-transferase